jgi:hypothetical protein
MRLSLFVVVVAKIEISLPLQAGSVDCTAGSSKDWLNGKR